MRILILATLLLFSNITVAHEMTPTYPAFTRSYMQGVFVTTMNLFNKRKDVSYYEIGVFAKEWEPIPFVSQYTIIPMKYLDTLKFDIYVSEKSLPNVEYICSISMLKEGVNVATKICSRVK